MVLRGRSRAARFTGVRCATRARLPWPLQAPSFMGPLHMLFIHGFLRISVFAFLIGSIRHTLWPVSLCESVG